MKGRLQEIIFWNWISLHVFSLKILISPISPIQLKTNYMDVFACKSYYLFCSAQPFLWCFHRTVGSSRYFYPFSPVYLNDNDNYNCKGSNHHLAFTNFCISSSRSRFFAIGTACFNYNRNKWSQILMIIHFWSGVLQKAACYGSVACTVS